MDSREPFVSVIVVNYNGRHFLAECLSALERQTLPRHRYEVLLIDNGSVDDSADFARLYFPGVRVIEAGANLGFTGANNLGFRLARGRYVVLLNNDTRPEPGWLAALVAAADGGRVGGVTSRVLFRDEPGQINSTGLVLYRDGRGGDRDLRRLDTPDTRRPDEVFGGCGASLLLTRELIDDVGGFDPTLFMYYEDLDLAWRARLRGWRFVYAPDAVVHHVCGGSTGGESPLLLRQVERNRTLVSLRNAPAFLAVWAGVGLVLRTGRLLVRFFRSTGNRPTAAHLRAMVAAVGSVVARLPMTLLERYRVRVAERRCPDRAVTRFVRARP
jgi:N-acetylglucosaminyl-diphospho-decaprenol L-rhamnosyltransferase